MGPLVFTLSCGVILRKEWLIAGSPALLHHVTVWGMAGGELRDECAMIGSVGPETHKRIPSVGWGQRRWRIDLSIMVTEYLHLSVSRRRDGSL